MVGAALRSVMLAAEGAGELTAPGVGVGAAEHPVCGDQVEVFVQLRDGVIDDLRWRASGCPASMAVAAAARPALCGLAPAAAAPALRQRLAQLGDLSLHERHAERLFLSALQRAVEACH
jgi:NifU-like protein involved in Fe-S cluster formation